MKTERLNLKVHTQTYKQSRLIIKQPSFFYISSPYTDQRVVLAKDMKE